VHHFDGNLVRRDRQLNVVLLEAIILIDFTQLLKDETAATLQVDHLSWIAILGLIGGVVSANGLHFGLDERRD